MGRAVKADVFRWLSLRAQVIRFGVSVSATVGASTPGRKSIKLGYVFSAILGIMIMTGRRTSQGVVAGKCISIQDIFRAMVRFCVFADGYLRHKIKLSSASP